MAPAGVLQQLLPLFKDRCSPPSVTAAPGMALVGVMAPAPLGIEVGTVFAAVVGHGLGGGCWLWEMIS